MHTKTLFALGFIALFGSGCAVESGEDAPSTEAAAAEETPVLYIDVPIEFKGPELEYAYPIELPDHEATTAPETSFDDVEPATPSAGADEDDVEADSAESDCVVQYVVTETGGWVAVPCR